MKPINIFIVLFLAFLSSCDDITDSSAGGDWILIRESSEETIYYSISFSDRNTGWICGSAGRVEKTVDGGNTWIRQKSSTTANLWSIDALNGLQVKVCGTNNTVLKTDDGGYTWTDISPQGPENRIFVSMKFADENNGWISSNYGELLKTTDGGGSWEIKRSGNIGGFRLSVLGLNTVYALGSKLYSTGNGGATWDSLELSLPKDFLAADMFFADVNYGWLAVDNLASSTIINEVPVLYTTDGGKNWLSSEPVKDGGIQCIYFPDKLTGWIAGIKNIYRSVDGGKHWSTYFSSPSGYLYPRDIFFVDKNNGWLISYYGAVYSYSDKQ